MTHSGGDPELSILLVTDSIPSIMRALRSFGEGADKTLLEVVVVSRSGQVLSADAIRAEGFTRVRTLSVESDSYDEAELRAVSAASAPWVVFALPNAFPQPGFVGAWRTAASCGDWDVIGPALSVTEPQNRLSRAANWIFSSPWIHDPPRGPMNSVPGHYSVYRRGVVLELGAELQDLLVAGEQLLVALRRRSRKFLIEPSMLMMVTMPRRPCEFIQCVFQNARIYAYKRRRQWTLFRRLVYGAGMPFIPLVRLPRIHRQIRRAGKERETLLDAPFLLMGLAISAAGECCGYLFGPGKPWRFQPGDTRNPKRRVVSGET